MPNSMATSKAARSTPVWPPEIIFEIILDSLFVTIHRQHVAEKISLFNRIIESDVGMRLILEPAAGHVSLYCLTIFTLQQSHGVGLNVQGRERERTLAGKSNQVPIHE